MPFILSWLQLAVDISLFHAFLLCPFKPVFKNYFFIENNINVTRSGLGATVAESIVASLPEKTEMHG